MDRIAIIGGARLQGEIPISGAKNSAIKLMAASLLTEEPLRLTNMPRLADTRFLGKLLQRLGTQVVESEGADGPETLLTTREIVSNFAPYDLVRQMRATFNVLGPLLARTGQAKVSLPGGCTIGARPVDLHLKALEALGAHIDGLAATIQASGETIRLTDFTGRAGPGNIGGSGTIGLAGAMPVDLHFTANDARREFTTLVDTAEDRGDASVCLPLVSRAYVELRAGAA